MTKIKMKKYEAVEELLAGIADDVDRYIATHAAHLPSVTAAAIRAEALRYAEGLLCLMTAEELSSPQPQHAMLRDCVRADIEKKAASAIADAFPVKSALVN